MASQIKTSSLRNLSLNKDGVRLRVGDNDEVKHLAPDTAAAKALESFYIAALKELHLQQDAIGQHLSAATTERLAREAASHGKSSGAPAPTATTPSSGGFMGWLRQRMSSIFGKSAEAPAVAPDAPAGTGEPEQVEPFVAQMPGETPESPLGKVPAMGSKDDVSPRAFRPIVTPPPSSPVAAAPAPASATSVKHPVAPASPSEPASSPVLPAQPAKPMEIQEVFADENGIYITWNNDSKMSYGPEHPLSRMLLVSLEKLIEANIEVANVKEVAALWDAKAKAKGAATPAPAAKATPAPVGEPAHAESPDDLPVEESEPAPEVNFEDLPPLDRSAAPEAPAPVETVAPSAPTNEASPSEIDAAAAAAPVASTPVEVAAPAPAPAAASPEESVAPTVPAAPAAVEMAPPAIESGSAADVAALAEFASVEPLQVRIINGDGSKTSIALWQKDGVASMLSMDDVDIHDLKRAAEAETGPKLTHMRRTAGKDGKDTFHLYFDEKLEGPGVEMAAWQKGDIAPAAPADPSEASIAELPVAPAPEPAAAAPTDGLPDLPAAPAKIVTGTRPVGGRELE